MAHRKALALLAILALAIVWIGNFTDLDLRLANAMYDHAAGTFPLRHVWLAETFSHVYMKNLLILLAACAVLAAIFPRPHWPHALRLKVRVVALSSVLVPLVISVFKQASFSHCPWDLSDFGGTQTYVRLLDAALAGAPAGHCMPAGHASGALWLVSLAIFWLPGSPRKAAAVALATLGFGFALGWVQQLRGAHFLTHTLWSMWIACAIVWALHVWVVQGWRLAALKRGLRLKPGTQVSDGTV
jgi:membrane-associated PAP2 superfamily phosphatase